MIAVMIAAAMCVVPLFVIEDADAATITTGEYGASFEGSDIPIDKFNELLTNDYVDGLILTSVGFVPVTEAPTVTKVVSLKSSVGNKNGDNSGESAMGQYAKLEVVIEGDLYLDLTLFELEDGFQDLFKYLGNTNKIASGTHLKIEGTVEVSRSIIGSGEFYKTDAGKIAATKEVTDMSTKSFIDLKYTFKVGGVEKVVQLKETSISSNKATVTLDYDTDDRAKVVDGTKVFITTVNDDKAEITQDFSFDGKSASYSHKTVVDDSKTFQYRDAGDVLINMDMAPSECYYYSADDDVPTLFNPAIVPAGSTTIRSNAGMKSFLEGIGSVNDSYSNAKSIADSAASSVSGDGSGGSNNIIFYVIIGVLAVAVVALAVLMIKKK